jgi:hypothetical protein
MSPTLHKHATFDYRDRAMASRSHDFGLQDRRRPVDFSLSPEIEDYRCRVRAFVEANILPLEADPASFDAHENIADAPL